jgi:hypothetical protein
VAGNHLELPHHWVLKGASVGNFERGAADHGKLEENLEYDFDMARISPGFGPREGEVDGDLNSFGGRGGFRMDYLGNL